MKSLKNLKVILCLALALSLPSVALAAPPKWSVIIYAGADVDDLDEYIPQIIDKLLATELSSDVELLIEHDAFGKKQDARYIHRAGEAVKTIPLDEFDSADPKEFSKFLEWAKTEATGEHKLFITIAHSWGWKGIIQDYGLPANTDPLNDTGGDKGTMGPHPKNDMMPLRKFAGAIRDSGLNPDVLLLDACVLGTAEAVQEMEGTTRYLLVSQRETPYNGYPYEQLLQQLAVRDYSALDLAKMIPQEYVRAYSRGGSLVPVEGEHDIITMAAVDMAKWDAFADKFKEFVDVLKGARYRDRVLREPEWADAIADEDKNTDIVELLSKIATQSRRPDITAKSNELLQMIGYPVDVANESAMQWEFDPKRFQSFKMRVQCDELLEPNEKGSVLDRLKARWAENNQDLKNQDDLKFSLESSDSGRFLIVEGDVKGLLRVRPWMNSTRQVTLEGTDHAGRVGVKTYSREQDYFVTDNFPESSFLVAEAHTQGAPFIHGIGVHFHPGMDASEERGLDQELGLIGPAFYRSIRWNAKTGWGDLILLNK